MGLSEEERKSRKLAATRRWVDAHPDYHANYRQTHQAERKAYNAQYAEDHRVERAAYKQAYDKAHAQEKAAYTAQDQRVNQESVNAKTARWRRAHPEAKRASEHRRRVRTAGGEVEAFVDIEIFERDNYMCGICHKKINRRRKSPDLLSPSLDHIVAISNGGHHVRTNVQAAHLRCNLSKGNR